MAPKHAGTSSNGSRHPRTALDPLVTDTASSQDTSRSSSIEAFGRAILHPWNHKRSDSNKILSDLAPVIMTPRMINAAATVASRPRQSLSAVESSRLGFATLGRAPLRIGAGTRRITSRDLQILEATQELLETDVPEPEGVASDVSLLRGFNATIPSAEKGKSRRRQARNVEAPRIGLKKLGVNARGLLGDDEESVVSMGSEDDVVLVGDSNDRKSKKKRRGRESLAAGKTFGHAELKRQQEEILRDKENLHVRRSLVNNEINDITHKIEALDAIRDKLQQDLLKLQEDELELEDELEGVRERMEFEEASTISKRAPTQQPVHHIVQSSRRRKGPAFLPSEHDELPPGVAFMTLSSHTTPITALDFSEPYGTLVTAAQEDTQPRVWDLLSGTEVGRLRGHRGAVKCVQVEDHICLTGAEDGSVHLWDLRRLEDDDDEDHDLVNLSDVAEHEAEGLDTDLEVVERPNGVRSVGGSVAGSEGPCVRVLEGHTKAVSALFFEEDCMVTGASDKTLRQWDLRTGQCVMAMDILWAISHPTSGAIPLSSAAAATGHFSVPTPPYADGSREMYQDFVGAVQFWGYALVSGSGDGVVRMWDMRTGQPHRTLLGHTAPVTSLQFDEMHIVSGGLDKSIRIWDLRMGSLFETIKYDFPVTALQFDSRKIVAATGENGIKIYNRTTMQQSTLATNGHTSPVERLRYMDRYMVSGGRDSIVKVWAL